MTGGPGAFTPATRAAIRDSHPGCVGCGSRVDELHHVRPRGIGGTSNAAIRQPWNGLPVCRSCHRIAESRRSLARDLGWLTTRPDPDEPFWTCRLGWCRWVLLDDGPTCWCIQPFQTPPSPGRDAAARAFQHQEAS